LFEYQLKRSTRRKTLAIKVHNQHVTVYAPHYIKKTLINEWITDKAEWVTVQLHKQAKRIDSLQYPLQSHQIFIFDTPRTLHFSIACKSSVVEHSNSIVLTLSSRVKKRNSGYSKLLIEHLSYLLENYIEMQVKHYCKLMALPLPHQIKIRIYKRRWGSCNSKRELTFNLLLVGAPKYVIDYVIVHELAHLTYLNHSRAFWAQVERFFPQYKKATQWLKYNGNKLQWCFY
jgi:predicted metal-dependent hydrolase